MKINRWRRDALVREIENRIGKDARDGDAIISIVECSLAQNPFVTSGGILRTVERQRREAAQNDKDWAG
jgi:hypothetical protein